jgi:hypothetical protein
MLMAMAFLTASASNTLSAPPIPYDLRGAIIVRSVGYEYGFLRRAGPAVLAVVGGSSGESAEDADAMASVFAKLVEKTPVANRPASVMRVTYESKAKTEEVLRAKRVEIVYVARGMSAVIPDIPIHEGPVVRIIVCGDGDDVRRGCALAVARTGNKPQLLLNVKHANAVGLRFDPQLLRLARIAD